MIARIAGGVLLAAYLLLFAVVMAVIVVLECFDFKEKPTILKPKSAPLA